MYTTTIIQLTKRRVNRQMTFLKSISSSCFSSYIKWKPCGLLKSVLISFRINCHQRKEQCVGRIDQITTPTQVVEDEEVTWNLNVWVWLSLSDEFGPGTVSVIVVYKRVSYRNRATGQPVNHCYIPPRHLARWRYIVRVVLWLFILFI